MTKDLSIYGWKVNEENLKTLPEDAPQGAKDLAKYLTLEGRRRSLVEWLDKYQDDGRIHGKFWNIGAWSGRMSHSSPNMANIASPWPKDKDGNKIPATTSVEEVKHEYDDYLRALWETDKWLVGTDAEGIQLRVLAHYMNDPKFTDALVKGDSKLGTDAHTMNMKALGPICRTRDNAKTFIYAWLLGAALPKIAEILSCSIGEAKIAVNNFLRSYPGLKKLKEFTIPRDAYRGYFFGLDGRRVNCNSEHLMLAGYLQNGEAVIMKRSNIAWRHSLKSQGIWFNQVNFVHDEWQTEALTHGDAEKIGKTQCWSIEDTGVHFGLKCPLAGKYQIGKNWKETH